MIFSSPKKDTTQCMASNLLNETHSLEYKNLLQVTFHLVNIFLFVPRTNYVHNCVNWSEHNTQYYTVFSIHTQEKNKFIAKQLCIIEISANTLEFQSEWLAEIARVRKSLALLFRLFHNIHSSPLTFRNFYSSMNTWSYYKMLLKMLLGVVEGWSGYLGSCVIS